MLATGVKSAKLKNNKAEEPNEIVMQPEMNIKILTNYSTLLTNGISWHFGWF